MPGVRAVGMVQTIPIRADYLLSFSIQGRPSEPGKEPSANYRAITPGYFEALTIPLLRGRLFTNADAPPRLVAVIDEAFAKQHFAGEDPIGRAVHMGKHRRLLRNLGVVGSVRHEGLDTNGRPTMYAPFRTDLFGTMWVMVKTAEEPLALAPAARQVLRELDAAIPAASLERLDTVVTESVAPRRFSMLLLSAFAVVALFLARRRPVRRGRVCGEPAHEGDRAADGHRRAARRRPAHGGRRRHEARDDWRRGRASDGALARALRRQHALRRHVARPRQLWCDRRRAAHRLRDRLLHPRASSDNGGSIGGVASRVGTPPQPVASHMFPFPFPFPLWRTEHRPALLRLRLKPRVILFDAARISSPSTHLVHCLCRASPESARPRRRLPLLADFEVTRGRAALSCSFSP